VCRHSFDVFGLCPCGNVQRGDALDEAMAAIHVEDENPNTAVLDVVTDPGRRHVQEVTFVDARAGARGPGDGNNGACAGEGGDEPACVHRVL
jgi:hypothetical protein